MGFVLLVFGLTSAIFGSWGLVTYRGSQQQQRRFVDYKAQALRDELSLSNLTRNLTPRLTDHDLDLHLGRVYFEGNNSLAMPWELNPAYIPKELRDIVSAPSFRSFATSCNELLAWTTHGADAVWYQAAMALVPPVATLLLRHQQLRRIERLNAFVLKHGASLCLDGGLRARGTKLKLGFRCVWCLLFPIDEINTLG